MIEESQGSDPMKRFIDSTELRERLSKHDRLQLVDVRSPGEYSSGHVPGAMNVPMDEVAARIDDLENTSPVVLICHSGERSEMSCETIEPHHGDLYVLHGGTEAWIQAGLPVVRSTSATWPIERQVRFAAGLLLLTGVILGWQVSPSWYLLSAFIGCGLTFSGLTGWCGMGVLMAKMPWNRPPRPAQVPRVGEPAA